MKELLFGTLVICAFFLIVSYVLSSVYIAWENCKPVPVLKSQQQDCCTAPDVRK